MKANTTKVQSNGTSASVDTVPDEFVCVDEDEAVQVFDYFNGSNANVDRELVGVHLRVCYQCQEAVASLMMLDSSIKKRLLELKPISALS
jgi:hypothetical protein